METIRSNNKLPRTKPDNISIIWHEGVAGRKAEEIACAFLMAFQKERDKKKFILWLDNCSAQNKNYMLFSLMVTLVKL